MHRHAYTRSKVIDKLLAIGYAQFTLHVAMLFCCEDLELGAETDEFVNLFQTMESGFVALPVNLPGTTFYKALKVRSSAPTHALNITG